LLEKPDQMVFLHSLGQTATFDTPPRHVRNAAVEPTFSPEGRLSGGEQTYFRQVLNFAFVP